MSTHSSVLALGIPWTEDPGGLQSMESQRDTTKQLTFTFSHVRNHPPRPLVSPICSKPD